MHASLSSLVRRRGSVFWFRKAVPVDLIDRLGRSDIRRSLRTCNLRVAKQRAWSLVLLIEDAFAELRAAGFTPGARAALDAILNQMMDDFDQDARQWSQRQRYRSLIESLGGEAAGPDREPRSRKSVDEHHPDPAGSGAVQRLPTPDSDAIVIPARNAYGDSGSGHPAYLDTKAIAQAVLEQIRLSKIHPKAHGSLMSFLPEYLARLRAKNRGGKYIEEVARKMEIFVATAGDRPVHEYGKTDLLDYRDIIDKMPADAIKHLTTDVPEQAIALNRKRAIPLPTISPTTVDAKYLSAVRGLFSYLVEQGILESNPAENVRSQQHDADGEELLDVEVRLPFTDEMLSALMSATASKSRATADYWWSRVLPRTGLRVNEFVQLSVADIREHHGRMCIDLLHHDDGDLINARRRTELRLKTQAARRIVPVSQVLIDEGFLDFVERRRAKGGPLARLFPQEKPDKYGNLSSAFSKRANRIVRKLIKDRRHVVYSARHSFASACDDAGLPEDTRNMFMGHQPERDDDNKKPRARHVSSRYGSPLPTVIEFEWFDKIRFT